MSVGLSITALVAIVAGFGLGHLLFRRRGSGGARRLSAGVSVLTGAVWLSAGIFAVIGGFEIIGMFVIAVFFFIARGNYRVAAGGEGIRARIAG